jgi:hypothetical protein
MVRQIGQADFAGSLARGGENRLVTKQSGEGGGAQAGGALTEESPARGEALMFVYGVHGVTPW